MIEELSSVALTRAFPEHGLAAGDIGTIVFRYPNGEGFEVEFVTGEGKSLAVLTLTGTDMRELGEGEILHARAITNPYGSPWVRLPPWIPVPSGADQAPPAIPPPLERHQVTERFAETPCFLLRFRYGHNL